ncbi:MAG TPA: alpha/beta hydrolase [Devosia sp.]|jgi:pimeloyl-ACP methyl ester carboxylesterase|nr:alpha/beta hydrolase [Devosia sp.]
MKLASIGLAAFALLVASPALADPVKNIVLVHGAWADGSGWQGVYAILKKDGYNVSVVSNPLTSLADDVAATDRVVDRQDGPVILVGHSYGGAVITEAGDNPKVAGLVYVAAFAPDKGESVLGLLPKDGPQPPIEVTKDGFIFFSNGAYQAAFAAGVPPAQADFMQASQVPLAAAAGNAPLTVAAWKTKPSWYVVAKDDLIIPPDAERGMAKRAGSTTVEMPGGHVAFVVDPQPVVDLIEKAANGVK